MTVHLVVLEGLPAAPFDALESELAESSIGFRRTVRTNSPYAAMELYIPPAVIVALAVNSLSRHFNAAMISATSFFPAMTRVRT